MGINKITFPSGAAPILASAWGNMIDSLLAAQNIPYGACILTDYESVGSAPSILQGTYIRHTNLVYKVETSDEAITGTPVAGFNYVALTVSGTSLIPSWVTSFSGYTWNAAYGGWYNGTTQIINQGVYLDGAAFRRFAGPAHTRFIASLADGRLIQNNKDLKTLGGNIDLGGGIATVGTLTAAIANIANANITNLAATTGNITNMNTGNANITGGSATGLTSITGVNANITQKITVANISIPSTYAPYPSKPFDPGESGNLLYFQTDNTGRLYLAVWYDVVGAWYRVLLS